jgi:hypothetical protein
VEQSTGELGELEFHDNSNNDSFKPVPQRGSKCKGTKEVEKRMGKLAKTLAAPQPVMQQGSKCKDKDEEEVEKHVDIGCMQW